MRAKDSKPIIVSGKVDEHDRSNRTSGAKQIRSITYWLTWRLYHAIIMGAFKQAGITIQSRIAIRN